MQRFWLTSKLGKLSFDLQCHLDSLGIDYVCTQKEIDLFSLDSVKQFIEAHQITHIVNLAAHMKIDLAENEQKDMAYLANGDIPPVLAKAARDFSIHLIHISTDYVFDGMKEDPYKEEDVCHPIQVYGKSKRLGEQKMLEVYPSALSLRVASLYGAKRPNVVSTFIEKMQKQEIVHAIIDQTSSPTFNQDVARAIYDLKDQSGILHFVNRGSASRFDLANEIEKLCKEFFVPIVVKQILPIAQTSSGFIALRPVRSVLSTEKVEKILKWKIPTWQEALRTYFKANYHDQQ